MREIKFRVWDKNKKIFIPEDTYAIINRTSFSAFGVMLIDWEDYREGEYFYDNAQELILFTGLTDKNGKGIYEEDVLSDGIDKYRIWFEDGSFLIGGLYKEWDKAITQYDFQYLEIIGNIYENPELLNSEQNDKPSVATADPQ
jgi:hypothetical protein